MNGNEIRLRPTAVRPEVHTANYCSVRQARAVWGERRIQDLELILALEGRFELLVDGAVVPHRTGEVLVIFPGEDHVYRRAPDCRVAAFSCIHCELESGASWLGGDYRCDPPIPRLTRLADPSAVADRFRAIAAAWVGCERYREELLVLRMRELWLLLADHWDGGGAAPVGARSGEMLHFLRERATSHPDRHDLARRFGLSPAYVNQLFRRELGCSPTEVVHRECCQQAYRLIREQGLAVAEVAERVGFGCPFYFSRVFTRVMGFPPSRA